MTEKDTTKENDSVSKSELSDLLACYCGYSNIALSQSLTGAYYCECRSCGKMSSFFGHSTAQRAKEAWNDSLKS